jgi:hypothetical protein
MSLFFLLIVLTFWRRFDIRKSNQLEYLNQCNDTIFLLSYFDGLYWCFLTLIIYLFGTVFRVDGDHIVIGNVIVNLNLLFEISGLFLMRDRFHLSQLNHTFIIYERWYGYLIDKWSLVDGRAFLLFIWIF